MTAADVGAVFVGGDAASSLIRRRRLARAHDELARPDASPPVTEVADRWGFSDAAHFTRALNAQYGHAPREARRQGQEAGA
jgi:AraC-like DNA-binding protein